MKTLAIVSSYSESCGNAAFTEVLHDSIEAYSDFKVEVLELNLKLLQSSDKMARRQGNIAIHALAKQLKNFDLVNIQLEPGLYGTIPSDIIQRVKCLIKANPNTTITVHSPRLISSGSEFRSGLKKVFMLNPKGFKELFTYFFNRVYIKINRKLIKYAIQKNCRLIVHTHRAKEQIGFFYNYKNVDVHPLKIVPEEFQACPSYIDKLRKNFDFNNNDVLIGMFGYISPYKGHLDAIKALQYLPENYKLLIFGRQHPQTLKAIVDPYLKSLVNFVESSSCLKDRVIFIGELEHQEFLHMAASMDLTWLPYYENGQDGSGIASICMDLSPRVLCSASFAFDELFKLIPYQHYLRFDIGNTLELASKTKTIIKQEVLANPLECKNHFTIKTQAAMYTREA